MNEKKFDKQQPIDNTISKMYAPLMVSLDEQNRAALATGKNRMGYWIGPEISNLDGLHPGFVLASPVDTIVPHSWGDQEHRQEAYMLVRRYVVITPDGPVAIRFNKRIVDQNGNIHPGHMGPGMIHDADFDATEGGEIGTFLPLLQANESSEIVTTPFGRNNLGLGHTEDGKLAFVIGDGRMQHGIYSQSNNTWGLEPTVNNESLAQAITNSKLASEGKQVPGPTELENAKLIQQAELIKSLL